VLLKANLGILPVQGKALEGAPASWLRGGRATSMRELSKRGFRGNAEVDSRMALRSRPIKNRGVPSGRPLMFREDLLSAI
jgi:hypothetical protein